MSREEEFRKRLEVNTDDMEKGNNNEKSSNNKKKVKKPKTKGKKRLFSSIGIIALALIAVKGGIDINEKIENINSTEKLNATIQNMNQAAQNEIMDKLGITKEQNEKINNIIEKTVTTDNADKLLEDIINTYKSVVTTKVVEALNVKEEDISLEPKVDDGVNSFETNIETSNQEYIYRSETNCIDKNVAEMIETINDMEVAIENKDNYTTKDWEETVKRFQNELSLLVPKIVSKEDGELGAENIKKKEAYRIEAESNAEINKKVEEYREELENGEGDER